MATVAELRQILKEDSNGKNLYDHLTETLMKVRYHVDSMKYIIKLFVVLFIARDFVHYVVIFVCLFVIVRNIVFSCLKR